MVGSLTNGKALVSVHEAALKATVVGTLSDMGLYPIIARDRKKCVSVARSEKLDIVVIGGCAAREDRSIAICQELRALGEQTIIFLTSCVDEAICAKGLDADADDCIGLPLRAHEFAARVRACLRRRDEKAVASSLVKNTSSLHLPPIILDDFEIDPERAILRVRGVEVSLPQLRFRLLHRLASQPGRFFSADELIRNLWDVAPTKEHHSRLRVHIHRIREEIEVDPTQPALLLSIKKTGYAFLTSPNVPEATGCGAEGHHPPFH